MTTRSTTRRPETAAELDAELARRYEEVEAADTLPLTPEDQAWFESLPEAPPLPSKEGDTLVIFFKKAPASSPAAPRKKPTSRETVGGSRQRRPIAASRRRSLAKGGKRQR